MYNFGFKGRRVRRQIRNLKSEIRNFLILFEKRFWQHQGRFFCMKVIKYWDEEFKEIER